jgi:hypothetical protein
LLKLKILSRLARCGFCCISSIIKYIQAYIHMYIHTYIHAWIHT